MKNYQLHVLSCLILLFSSCEKYLEQAPDDRAELDSPEKVSELLTSAYPKASYFAFAESMSDNSWDKGVGMGSQVFMNYDPWMFNDVRDRNQDTPDFYWYQCYAAISVANRALKHIETVSDPENYRAQKGEALIARAYAHFMLAVFFSKTYDPITADFDPGIPYVTEPEETLLKKYERKTVAYTYAQIEKDLLEGIPLLNDAGYKSSKYHFTKAAAHAFASRFYLFYQQYGKVVSHASEVFGRGDLSSYLRPTNSTEYRQMEYNNKLADYTKASNPANILLVEAVSNWGNSFPGFRFGLSSELLNQLFFSANPTGGNYAYMIYGSERAYNIPKFHQHFVQSGLNANYGTAYNMIPLFTAEEVLLNRAEAYAMLSKIEDSLVDLNSFASKKVFVSQDQPIYHPQLHGLNTVKLLNHYQNPDMQYCLLQTVLEFKRCEFLFEGLRYLDILRHHLPVEHKTKDGEETYYLGPNDLRRILQLPQEVILSGIEANPR